MDLYDQCSPDRQQELEEMINDVFAKGFVSHPPLERRLHLPPDIPVDHLPTNWKEQMAALFQSKEWSSRLLLRQVSEELDRRKKEALLSP